MSKSQEEQINLIRKWALAQFRGLLKSARITEQIKGFLDNPIETMPLRIQINLTAALKKKLQNNELSQYESENL